MRIYEQKPTNNNKKPTNSAIVGPRKEKSWVSERRSLIWCWPLLRWWSCLLTTSTSFTDTFVALKPRSWATRTMTRKLGSKVLWRQVSVIPLSLIFFGWLIKAKICLPLISSENTAGQRQGCYKHGSNCDHDQHICINLLGNNLFNSLLSHWSMDCKLFQQPLPEHHHLRRHEAVHHFRQVHKPPDLLPPCFFMLCSVSQALCPCKLSHKPPRNQQSREKRGAGGYKGRWALVAWASSIIFCPEFAALVFRSNTHVCFLHYYGDNPLSPRRQFSSIASVWVWGEPCDDQKDWSAGCLSHAASVIEHHNVKYSCGLKVFYCLKMKHHCYGFFLTSSF